MQYVWEHLGVMVCAMTGALAGRGTRLDLFGIVVLALVTAVGGGTLRDLVLGAPVFWVWDGSFVLTATGAALLTFLWGRVGKMPHGVLLISDACGLALFTAIGVEKSLAYSSPVPVAVALGVVTGVAGGILRDALCGEVPLVFRPEIYLYATAAFCGACVFALGIALGADEGLPRVAAIATTLVMRLAAIRWKLMLPVFRLKEEAGV
jgi:uncharacterized membrane protein YeiH